MNAIGYLLIFVAALLLRGATKGRTIAELPDDLGDFFTAMVALDNAGMSEVLAREGSATVTAALTDAPGKASGGPAANAGENGKLPDSALVALSFANGHRLVPSAAADAERMNVAYKADFGRNISVTDSYRTYAAQVRLKAAKGRYAATPGTSNHGWGKALDLGGGINTWGSSQRNWMVLNAPRFGWSSPAWAQLGKSTPEPWHWEHA